MSNILPYFHYIYIIYFYTIIHFQYIMVYFSILYYKIHLHYDENMQFRHCLFNDICPFSAPVQHPPGRSE